MSETEPPIPATPGRARFCVACEQALVSTDQRFCVACGQALSPVRFPEERKSRLAVASLVSSLLWLGGLGSLLAVVFGHLSLGRIDRSAGREGGRGLAIAGLALGYLGIVAAFYLAFFLAFSFVSSNQLSARAQAVGIASQVRDDPSYCWSNLEAQRASLAATCARMERAPLRIAGVVRQGSHTDVVVGDRANSYVIVFEHLFGFDSLLGLVATPSA